MIQKLLRKARKGTRVIHVPVTTTRTSADFLNLRFGRVVVLEQTVHVTATGERYLVLHGDKFDGIVKYARWLALLGDTAYEWAMVVNLHLNNVRRFLKLPYWSLSAYLKRRVKRAVEFISHFETAVIREARARGATGVVCGHIHTPDIRQIGDIHYLNDGDWVESCTALVEHLDGRFEILEWAKLRLPSPNGPEMRILIATDAWSRRLTASSARSTQQPRSCGLSAMRCCS